MMARWRQGIWAASLALIVVLMLAATASLDTERRTTVAATARSAEHLTQLLGIVVDQMIRDVDGLVAGLRMALAISVTSGAAAEDEIWRWLQAGMQARPAVRSYHLIDRTGRVTRASRAELIGQNMASRMHFRTHRDGPRSVTGPAVSDPVFSPVSGHRQLLVTWPLHDATGGFEGVLVVGFDTAVVERRLGGLVDGAHDVVALVKDDRVILAAAGVGGTQAIDPSHRDQGLAALLAEIDQVGHETAISRTATLFGSRASWVVDAQPLAMIEGSVILARNLDEALEPWRRHRFAVGLAVGLVITAILAAAAALARHLGRQSRALAAATSDAVTDPLTGLANRRLLESRAALELDRMRQHGGWLALIVLDIDHFKQINDRHGHAAGDGVLIAIAECLRSAIRGDDLLARIGGEEFAILMPRTPLVAARRRAERLRRAVEQLPIVLDDCSVGVTISVGVAPVEPATTLKAALAAADAALYHAKTQGRNRTVLAETSQPALAADA